MRIENLYKLNEFREKVSSSPCSLCELYGKIKKYGYKPVVSRGNGRIMFVGMAPSFDEHSASLPFDGPLGALLRGELERILGVQMDEHCYLTNLVKCHPEDMEIHQYKVSHKKACSYYLFSEIQLVDPLIIVFFGSEVFDSFVGPDLNPNHSNVVNVP